MFLFVIFYAVDVVISPTGFLFLIICRYSSNFTDFITSKNILHLLYNTFLSFRFMISFPVNFSLPGTVNIHLLTNSHQFHLLLLKSMFFLFKEKATQIRINSDWMHKNIIFR